VPPEVGGVTVTAIEVELTATALGVPGVPGASVMASDAELGEAAEVPTELVAVALKV
jgi:hypothetical protein